MALEIKRLRLEIKRLRLASVTPPGTRTQWPVHGFVVGYPGGAALADTGVGGPRGPVTRALARGRQ